MIRIAICDDSVEDLQNLSAHLKVYIKDKSIEANIVEYTHPEILLAECEKKSFDILLLDVVMPMLTGIDVGKELRKRKSKTSIIYLTSSPEYAVDAFSLRATHYLLKPYTMEQFDEAISRTLESISDSSLKKLSVDTKNGELYLIDINDICYIESQRHDISIHTEETSITTSKQSLGGLQEQLERLSPKQFISPYKGYIVNQKKILWISRDSINIKGGATIPISKRSSKLLKTQFKEYIFERGDDK